MTTESSRNHLKRNGDPAQRMQTASVNGNGNGNGHDHKRVMITGGAGFIGTNLAHRLLSAGEPVLLYDNISRPGVEQNLEWLRAQHGRLVHFIRADVRDSDALREAVKQVSHVFHFAAQVAVTTSLADPLQDFEINAHGTLNLIEALRSLNDPPPLLYASTNKVYGNLRDVMLRGTETRYQPVSARARAHGFSEDRAIHFHSPYGCSKGAAEQYVLDSARTFGLRTAVFRMSCIYGLHQFGTEDQGWVAHFLIRALQETPITIYGDGRQVRDVLFVDDLVDAFLLARRNINTLAGQVFNIGGGPCNTTSLLELLELIRELNGRAPEARFDSWRTADQQYYVSDTRKFSAATGWTAKTGVREGVAKLREWLQANQRTAALSLPAETSLIGPANRTHANGIVRAKRPPRLRHAFKLPGRNGKRSAHKLTKAL